MTAHVVEQTNPNTFKKQLHQVKKKGPKTNQPTNKQIGFDLSISFTKWPSMQATATHLKIPQKMAWWPQTRLKSFFGAPQPRTSKDHKRCVFRLSMAS